MMKILQQGEVLLGRTEPILAPRCQQEREEPGHLLDLSYLHNWEEITSR